jgi:serpin B
MRTTVQTRACARWLLLAPLVLGCAAKSPVRPLDARAERQIAPEARAEVASVVAGSNRFAFEIYGRLRATPGNLFLSPISIATAFGMVQAGARGETEREIAGVFHFPAADRLHPAFGALRGSLDRGGRLGNYELRTANGAWIQRDFATLPEFRRVLDERYGAAAAEADFRGDPDAARRAINAWVDERTDRRIPELFAPGSLNHDTRIALVNAIVFKGRWAAPFDPARTRPAVFKVGDGEAVEVPTMSQEGRFRLGRTDAFQMLELPYGGGDLSMLILLPHRDDGLAALEQQVVAESLDTWIAGLSDTRVQVALPRFGFRSTFQLPRVLSELGMPSAFTPGSADLSGIDGGRALHISAAVHQAFVEVDEHGTEAAAATGVGVGVVSMPPQFTADHPFLFLIHDHVTGAILFLGRVVDPRG